MENTLLYPDPATVFADPATAMYFKPLLTVMGQTPVHQAGWGDYRAGICAGGRVFRSPERLCGRFAANRRSGLVRTR